MSSKLKTKNKKSHRIHTAEQTFTVVFENGMLRPLAEIKLPKHKRISVTFRISPKSIASQMFGLCKPQSKTLLDLTIALENWL